MYSDIWSLFLHFLELGEPRIQFQTEALNWSGSLCFRNWLLCSEAIVMENPHLRVPVQGQTMWISSLGNLGLSQAFRWLRSQPSVWLWLQARSQRRMPSWNKPTRKSGRNNNDCCKPWSFKFFFKTVNDSLNSDYRDISETLQV